METLFFSRANRRSHSRSRCRIEGFALTVKTSSRGVIACNGGDTSKSSISRNLLLAKKFLIYQKFLAAHPEAGRQWTMPSRAGLRWLSSIN